MKPSHSKSNTHWKNLRAHMRKLLFTYCSTDIVPFNFLILFAISIVIALCAQCSFNLRIEFVHQCFWSPIAKLRTPIQFLSSSLTKFPGHWDANSKWFEVEVVTQNWVKLSFFFVGMGHTPQYTHNVYIVENTNDVLEIISIADGMILLLLI